MQTTSRAQSTLVFAKSIATLLLSSVVGHAARVVLAAGLTNPTTLLSCALVAASAIGLWLWLWSLADDGASLPRRLQALLYVSGAILGLLMGAF